MSDILTNCGDLTKRVKGEVVCQLSVMSLFYKNGGGGGTCLLVLDMDISKEGCQH